MPDLSELVRQGSANLWVFIPVAVMLGALHGLEPGHSKTMMAAFIIAVRGTVAQAALLGISAAFSHSLIVWVIAAVGLHFGPQWNAEQTEPWLQLASALIIAGLAGWMFVRTRRDTQAAAQHAQDHDHRHGDADHHHDGLSHDHEEFEDEHEKAHAFVIQRQFANRTVTTGQIVMFGLTGGLIPCPAAVTVLLICLQLKKFSLGFALVLSFSFGLAVTMVTVGVLAALSVQQAEKRFAGFGQWMRKAPYVSVAVLLLIAVAMGIHAVTAIIARS